jgi:hypothetical protein
MDPVEMTRLIANKWKMLPKDEKQPYLDSAHEDKERFFKELKAYNENNPDDSDSKNKKPKVDENSANDVPQNQMPAQSSSSLSAMSSMRYDNVVPPTLINSNSTSTHKAVATKKSEDEKVFISGVDCDLPIFTDSFLEHNKAIEIELKSLRRNNVEIEQQNSVLMKHIENMENGVTKVEAEIAEHKKKNNQLEVYLTKLRCKLSANLSALSWKGNHSHGATVENIDKYLNDLTAEVQKNASHSAVNKARDILKKMDLKIS